MTNGRNSGRNLIGGLLGTITVLAAGLITLIGLGLLALGIFGLVFGEFHGPWGAIVYIPVGAMFLIVGVAGVRFGLDSFRSSE
jgi:peptidoglycan/LPS O-acetylase OafA/YrhL